MTTDSFDRADNATSMGTADTGETWENLVAGTTWGIKGNQATCVNSRVSGVADASVVVATGLSDCVIEVDLVNAGSFAGDPAGTLTFRAVDYQNRWFLTENRFFKRVAGVVTQVGDVFAGPGSGDHVELVLSGAGIEVFVNGVSKKAVNDSALQTATKHGLYSFDISALQLPAPENINRYDNFTVSPLVVPGIHIGHMVMS